MSKKCFIISPIGPTDSEIRLRSDQVLKYIIIPIMEKMAYSEVTRADQISEPGIITDQIIQHLIYDDLVIADLTGANPNVYYELAVRHAVRKPVIQLIQAGEPIPFDVAGMRTIPLDHRNLDSVADCTSKITNQITAIEKDPNQVDSPISASVDIQSLRKSENPLEKSNAEIILMLQQIGNDVREISDTRKENSGTKNAIFKSGFSENDLLHATDKLITEFSRMSEDNTNDSADQFNRTLDALIKVVTYFPVPYSLVRTLIDSIENTKFIPL